MNDPSTPAGAPALPGFRGDEAFRRLVEGIHDYAIYMLNPQGMVATWNAGAQRITGYAPADIIGRHFSVFYPADALASAWPSQELEAAADLGRFENEGWRIRKDGSRFWANVVITALHGATGELLGFSKITRDLTERRRHEERLRQSEENFRLLVEGVEDYAIFRLDANGIVASWNLGAERIKGYAAHEIIGQHFSRFYRDEEVQRGWPQHELAIAGQTGRFEDEGWRVRKNGTLFWANVVITAIHDEHGAVRGYSKITRDLTERRRNEQRLKANEERLRLLVEGVKDHAIFMLDANGLVSEWNAGAQRVHGFEVDDIIGRSGELLYTPEDIAVGKPRSQLAAARDAGFYEEVGWRMRRDGNRFPADVTITVLRDHDGAPYGFAHITRDLTERRRVQELETEGKRINEFIAMLAHELRNPLAPISNAVEILQKAGVAPELQWCADIIGRQLVHLSRLVDDLLEISRITSGKIQLRKQTLDLAAVVTAAAQAMQPVIARLDHVLELKLPPEPVHVDGDATRLTQVIVNLLTNAAKYTPRGGRIEICLQREGNSACVSVIDNGIGMPRPLLDTAFDLFVQGERALDRSEGGLGIGLTLVRRIVRLHGGDAVASSEGVGKGTKVTLSLPLARPLTPEPPAAAAPAPLAARRILVVDDNVDAATSLAMLMRMAGHTAALAYDGLEALRLAAADPPDAVLLDLGLPGLDGYAVARRIRAMAGLEHTRLIAMTGYGRDEDKRLAGEAGFDAYLVKPVTLDDVLSAMGGARLGLRPPAS